MGGFTAALLAVVCALGLVSCGGEAGVGQSTPTGSSGAVASPSPSPAPFQEIVIKGKGSELTDQFDLPEGQYKLTWSMQAVSTCCPNLIVDLEGQAESNLIASQDLAGSTLIKSGGGFFRFKVESEGTTWTLTIDQI